MEFVNAARQHFLKISNEDWDKSYLLLRTQFCELSGWDIYTNYDRQASPRSFYETDENLVEN